MKWYIFITVLRHIMEYIIYRMLRNMQVLAIAVQATIINHRIRYIYSFSILYTTIYVIKNVLDDGSCAAALKMMLTAGAQDLFIEHPF